MREEMISIMHGSNTENNEGLLTTRRRSGFDNHKSQVTPNLNKQFVSISGLPSSEASSVKANAQTSFKRRHASID